jgi:hypothetical protein
MKTTRKNPHGNTGSRGKKSVSFRDEELLNHAEREAEVSFEGNFSEYISHLVYIDLLRKQRVFLLEEDIGRTLHAVFTQKGVPDGVWGPLLKRLVDRYGASRTALGVRLMASKSDEERGLPPVSDPRKP